jgi:hypothetical protein
MGMGQLHRVERTTSSATDSLGNWRGKQRRQEGRADGLTGEEEGDCGGKRWKRGHN